ncbi:MAG: ATP-binding protein [Phycisphaeraceae bacterium]
MYAEIAAIARRGRPAVSRALLMRGEALIASVGIAVALILVATLGGAGYWLLHTERQATEQARRQRIEAVVELLAPTAEHMLATDTITPLRRLMMDMADRHLLSRCRVVVPGRGVVADADASRINVHADTGAWARPDADADDESDTRPIIAVTGGTLVLTYPLDVPGRGPARLEVMAELHPEGALLWEAQAGVGVLGVGSMLTLLLVYRRFRTRLRAIGVVREALMALERGESAEAALAVSEDLGAEAAAWNHFLKEHAQLRQRAAVDHARDQQGAASAGDELTAGCDAVPHGLMLVDDRARVAYANHTAGLYCHHQRDAMVGRAIGEVVPYAELAEAIAAMASGQVRRRQTLEVEPAVEADVDPATPATPGVSPAAPAVPQGQGVFRASLHPIRRGDRQFVMVVVDDVTQQRVAEQSRHQFVAQATHELRTPLTNIRLYLETAQDEGESDAAVRAKCLNVINQEARRLERLVGEMLSVAEIEAGALQLNHDDVRLDTLLGDIEADYQAAAKEKQISLRVDMPPKLPIIHGDRDKLILAVQNVISNAIKYTPENGQVTITVALAESHLAIDITDTGLGIAPEDQDRIFERFYRARDRRIAAIQGTGLGLGLAREIIRLHAGDITVESQIDKGSTFTLTLPTATDATTATE